MKTRRVMLVTCKDETHSRRSFQHGGEQFWTSTELNFGFWADEVIQPMTKKKKKKKNKKADKASFGSRRRRGLNLIAPLTC